MPLPSNHVSLRIISLPLLNNTFSQTLRTKYTCGFRDIVARTPLPPPRFSGPSIVLDDGSILQSHTNAPEAAVSSTVSLGPLPPLTRPAPVPLAMTADMIHEIRQLRATNPSLWSTARLAKKYAVSKQVIMRWAPLSPSEKMHRETVETERIAHLTEKYKRRMLFRLKRKEMLLESYAHFHF